MTKISIKNLAYAIYDILKESKSSDDISNNSDKIINFIKNKNLLNKTDLILKELEDIINKENGLMKVEVTLKQTPNSKEINELKDVIKNRFDFKEVLLEVKEDKDIIGGIRLEMDNKVLDMTYKNKLSKLKDYLIKN
jgi:F-type H+-transporting ATPase subunit delta